MYALSGTRGFDIPITEIRTLLDRNPNRNIMGISVLSEEESDTLQTLLTLDAAVAALEPVDIAEEDRRCGLRRDTGAHSLARPTGSRLH
ncbi:hypothetical protein [Streptomyces sp. NPDC057325]|uniref:hypothetical protein n=1 Tax=unclassified Streptomyces TaxID=2593676 RepID=UPI003641CBC2